jgi:hypothetical protein
MALVDYFRESADIMIATEAAAEGLNLQFCSLVINYDLPWNPQRIEQRIGRCHRYGQKYDVVVVNFVNIRNHAVDFCALGIQKISNRILFLYRRDNGRYVLHRLMRMDGERLVCCGDRQTELETIRGEQVLAVVTAFCRKGVWRDVKDPLYRLYVQLWMILPLRRAAFALREGLRRSGLRP